MSITRISVNVDDGIKRNAQRILAEMGMDMTTAIDLLLRTIVREERIPFEICTRQAYLERTRTDYIKAELEKARLEAADPKTEWVSQADMVAMLTKQREVRDL